MDELDTAGYKSDICGLTDVGRIRQNNEDSYLAEYIGDGKKYILAVAIDGVGGYDGGEVAAALARDTIREYVSANIDSIPADELIRLAVINANNSIADARTQTGFSQMSCVLTATITDLEHAMLFMAHIGDTRLYSFCEGTLTKLSHDHSIVGYSEEMGELTEEQAMHHPRRNVISRDVGSRILSPDENDYVETASFPLAPEGTLMLCTDGLCDMITSAQMSEILSKDCSADMKASSLVLAANAAGGRDNVTVIVIDFSGLDGDEMVVTTERNNIISAQIQQNSDITVHENDNKVEIVEIEHVGQDKKQETDPVIHQESGPAPVQPNGTKMSFYELLLVAVEIAVLITALCVMAGKIFNLHIVQG